MKTAFVFAFCKRICCSGLRWSHTLDCMQVCNRFRLENDCFKWDRHVRLCNLLDCPLLISALWFRQTINQKPTDEWLLLFIVRVFLISSSICCWIAMHLFLSFKWVAYWRDSRRLIKYKTLIMTTDFVVMDASHTLECLAVCCLYVFIDARKFYGLNF